MNEFFGVHLSRDWSSLFKEAGVTHLWVEGWRFFEFWQAAFAAKRNGIKLWMHGETNDLRPRSGVKDYISRLALSQLFRRCDRFFFIGSANQRFYRSFGVNPEKLLSAPYRVDNDRFAITAANARPVREKLRDRWSIDENALCILFCGKFIEKKRPLDVIDGAMASDSEFIHLLFVGDGKLKPNLENLIEHATQQAAISNKNLKVTFAGFLNQTEIIEAYVAADCLVLPSTYGETWGLVANEAMACGVPVVASNHCGCAEDLVATCGSEFTYECGDVGALARAIDAVAKAPPTSDRISSAVDAHHFRYTHRSISKAYFEDLSLSSENQK